MNADAAFVTGKTHRVCQDYARADNANGSYVLIADGCSGSPDSDFGARLLVKCVEGNLVNPEVALREAAAAARVLKLPEESLDATLLIARWAYSQVKQDDGEYKLVPYIHAEAHGDGVIAAVRKDGDIEAYFIEYASGYPQYLNYVMNADRQARLTEKTGTNEVKITRWIIKKDGSSHTADPTMLAIGGVYQVSFVPEDYSLVALFSDGVATFTDSSLASIPWQKVVAEMMDIPARKGEFVQRQMNWMVKEIGKRRWTHSDDFSMGALNL